MKLFLLSIAIFANQRFYGEQGVLGVKNWFVQIYRYLLISVSTLKISSSVQITVFVKIVKDTIA